MYLSRLEIVGFKSFAQKTEFKFFDGLTAIVGPNGCGKTNIVDAIRWGLGEQKSNVLRSELMENVIFNGSKNRKPLGMAEVTIVFNNTKGVLPTEYSEVAVTRRLFRDGESQYLLNNAQCRLKDIIDLFMDTGIGADSYSVIELKMVEAILSGKPEERRHLIEEAAGINKYKLRKKEAFKKLSNVQNDLVRISDLVQEIEKQVNQLYKQAAKTKKYNKLYEEARALELNLLKIEFATINSDILKISNEIQVINENKNKFQINSDEIEKFIKSLETKLIEHDSKRKEIVEKDNLYKSHLAKINQEIAVNNERIISLDNNQIRNNQEISESKARLVEFNKNINDNLAIKKSLELKINELKEQINQKNEIINNAKKQLSEFRSETQELNDNIINLTNNFNYNKSILNKNNSKIDENNKQLKKFDEEIIKLNSEIETNIKEIDNLEEKKSNLILAIENKNNELSISLEKEKFIKSEIDKITSEINQNKVILSSKKTEQEFLNNLLDVDDTTKFLLKNTSVDFGKKPSLLIEEIYINEEYQIALESALGEYAHLLLIDKQEQAELAFAELQKNNKGKVSFICKENIKPISNEYKINHADGVIGVITDLIKADDALLNLVKIILPDAVITTDLSSAKRIVDNGLTSFAVTLKGEVYKNDGFLKGGGISKKEGLSVGKKEKINRLNKDIEKIQSDIESFELQLKRYKEDLKEINIYELNNELRKLENDLNNSKRNISQVNFKIEALSKNIELIESNKERIISENTLLINEVNTIDIKLSEIENLLKIKKEEFTTYKNQISSSQSELEKIEKEAKSFEFDLIKINAEIESLNNQNKKLENQINETNKKIKTLEDSIISNEKIKEELITKVEILNNDKESLEIDSNKIKNDYEFISSEISNIEQQIQQYSEDFSAIRKNLDRIIEQSHQKELTLTEIKSQQYSIAQKAFENYNIDISNFEKTINEELNLNQAKLNLKGIKERLQSFGNINPLAVDEYEEASNRYDFYKKQYNDLLDSEKLLQETISEIDKNATERFLSTFEIINNNFKMLFNKMFGSEGVAELKLNSDNYLESDIDIIARPPGKKPHSIDMLSGGEKTLTAISLLFAIYLVKPSPFCILDEVDAPLDDANIDNFLKLLREFSNNTQFLIVSHNKRTMELSDTLYGITMAEEGVSKVVSVRLSQN